MASVRSTLQLMQSLNFVKDTLQILAYDNQEFTIAIFLDLSKAFDTTPVKISCRNPWITLDLAGLPRTKLPG